jgi:exosortase E/protease (VPEID-CTERM system)
LLLGEALALGVSFDAEALERLPPGAWTWLRAGAGAVMPACAALLAALLLFGAARWSHGLGDQLRGAIARHRPAAWLAAHVVAFIALYVLSAALFGERLLSHPGALIAAWLAATALTLATWLTALAAPRELLALGRANAGALAAAAALGAVAFGVGRLATGLWHPLRRATFFVASLMLRPLDAAPVIQPDEMVLGTSTYVVEIAPECSGYEGVGLSAAFVGAALWLFRDRFAFPRAFLLLPGVAVVVWLANAARLVAMTMVGTHVSRAIAGGGFHSYAGALLFCAISLAAVAGALRWPWLLRAAPDARAGQRGPNVTAPFLLPFLVTLAAGLVSHSFGSAGADPLALLRPLAGLAAIALCARALRAHVGLAAPSPLAIAVGLAVAAAWLALVRQARVGASEASATALAARALDAIVVAPVVEELAFRGFLARRLRAVDFEHLPPERVGPTAAVLSSAAFAAMHQHWAAAFGAGLVYTWLYRRRGQLGDAVVAHALTNAALLVAGRILGSGWSGS